MSGGVNRMVDIVVGHIDIKTSYHIIYAAVISTNSNPPQHKPNQQQQTQTQHCQPMIGSIDGFHHDSEGVQVTSIYAATISSNNISITSN
jgi:hypothetical protein